MRRSSKWAFIVYPDSAPKDWQETLKSFKIPTAISPLHDKDLNPTGDEKKPHWHVFLEFDSLKSYDQVKEDTDIFNGTIPQPIKSPIGMIRYFIHKDNPEKHQYKWSDIVVYNGFDLSKYDQYTQKEIDYIIADITRFIDKNQIYEYADLIALTRESDFEHFEEWYHIIRTNTIFFNKYITSRRCVNQHEVIKKANQQFKKYCEKYQELEEKLKKYE